MAKIKAIETHYKGYRFRSRLEARWAVFLDGLGLTWEYEPQGFDLGEDGPYLPDFRILEWRCWVEIKPVDPERGYLLKPTAFAWNYGNRLLLIEGNPWPGEHLIHDFIPAPMDSSSLYGEIGDCRRCDGYCLFGHDGYHPPMISDGLLDIGPHTCGDHDRWPVSLVHGFHKNNRCHRAYRAARSARFEHGENPS